MTQTAGALAAEVAALLNDAEEDFEFTRWSESDLLEYARDGAAQVIALRPLDCAQSSKLTLAAGARQTLPDDALAFVRVDGTVDRYGRVTGMPSSLDADAARIAANYFEAIVCRDSGSSSGPYAVRAFWPDPTDERAFFVDPPVPAGQTVAAMVRYTALPAELSESDAMPVPAVYHNTVVEWMLYRAYSRDQDSATSDARAEAHKKTFFDLLGLKERAVDKLAKQNAMVSANAKR